MKEEITYMDCWHYIAPIIPITDNEYSMQVYVMIFKALSDADKREKEKIKNGSKSDNNS